MKTFQKLAVFLIVTAYGFLSVTQPIHCFPHQHLNQSSTHHNIQKMSSKMASDIALHGFLLWASVGLLMPVGILTIRLSTKEGYGTRIRVLFYFHVILQILSVLMATAGAVISVKSFENSFDNNHQRIGLALYCAIWVQAFIGFFRPHRGDKRRGIWYFVHWILGTSISLVGIFNIYTGLGAYHRKTSKSVGLWTILFTAEISFLAFLYLFQDKWDHIQKQGVILENEPISPSDQEAPQRDNQKVLPPEPCGKHNALKNLFD